MRRSKSVPNSCRRILNYFDQRPSFNLQMLRYSSQKPSKIVVASESQREILEYNLRSGVARSLGLRFAVSVKTPS